MAQAASGSGDGSSCSNAKAVTFFNTSGNWANPKQTGKIGPGDTVYLCGTITTTLTVQNSGSAGSPITISGVDATSIIDGNLTGLDLTSKNYITFGGNITFQNQTGVNSRAILIAGTSSELIIQDFAIDGSGTAYFGIILSTASAGNTTIRRGTLKKHTSSSISFNNWANASAILTMDDITIGGSLSDASFRGLSFSSLNGPAIHVSNVDISYSSATNGQGGLYSVQSNFGSGSYINDSTFTYTQNTSNVMIIDGSNLTFNRDTFSYAYGNTADCGGSGVCIISNPTAPLHDITFNNCIASYNDNDGFSIGQSGSALYNITYNNNVSHHNGRLGDINRGDGFTIHGNAYNLYYYYNIAYDNNLTAIAGVDTSSGYVYNMVSARNGVLNPTRAGLFFNNSAANSVTGTGWTIKNTISFDDMPYAIYLSTGSLSITTFDYNIYKLNGSATNFALLNTTANNFSTWQTTYDTHSLVSNPQFKDGDNNDYHLTSTSPAINHGVNLDLLTDYAGNSVPQGSSPDAGAYEFLLPAFPTSLSQYKSNGTTAISSGTFTNESSVSLKLNMSSSNSSDSLTPQIEIQPIGTAFTNSVTHSGSAVAYTGTAVTGTVSVTGLNSGSSYHWQARVSNSAGQSSWVSMGGNPDFKVDTSTPTSGSLLSPTNYTKNNTKPTLVFKKSTDSESGVSSYSVSLDSGKNRSFSTSGIPANGNGTANYIWKNDSTVKIEFVNENDTDTSNDEIHVYFKDLDNNELTEGKHSWTVTTTDSQSNSTSQSADFYLDKTSPSISDLSLANVSTIKSDETYKLSILNRTPSFSGLAIDLYQGFTKTNSNNSEDTFDKVSSGPQTVILTLKRQKDDKTYAEYLTKEYSLSDMQDINNDKKTARFYISTPFPLIDGYYQVKISLKDYAGNTSDQPIFYLTIGNVLSKSLEQIFTGNLDTKISDQQAVPAVTDEEKEAVKQNGYTVKIKVINTDNKPVLGAKVTIHSKVQETTTDENGMAVFNGVEPGDHKVLIAYANYEGEQTLNLSGDVKEFSISIQVKPQSLLRNLKVITASVIAGLIIIVLIVLLIKAKTKK